MMPIICFEGASAVGKTSTADFLQQSGAFVVPEVNLLFEKPAIASPEWYFERQVERWQIAREEAQNASGRLVILDGDVFQPLWYAWAYAYAGWQSLDFMRGFYEPHIQNGTINFPDRYFIFHASEAELRMRKEADATRKRRGFETHLQMIEPQRRYFQWLKKLSPPQVRFLKAESIASNAQFIRQDIADINRSENIEPQTLFNEIILWLEKN